MATFGDFVEVSVGFLLQEISRIITPSLPVRREAVRARGDYAPNADFPITGPELRSFINEFVADDPFIGDSLRRRPSSYVLRYPEAYLDPFFNSMYARASHDNWLGAEGRHYIRIPLQRSDIRLVEQEVIEPPPLGAENEFRQRIACPSLSLIFRLFRDKIDLDRLHWRELEKIVAEALTIEGWQVDLQPGTKDGGADLFALKEDPRLGCIKSVWQAKSYGKNHKVGVGIIRELAEVRNETHSTKGVIITTSYLTQGALAKIEKDRFALEKYERPDLEQWLSKVLCGQVLEL